MSRLAVLSLILASTAAAAPAAAQTVVQDDTTRPLVYVFSIDGLDGDAVTATDAPFLRSVIGGQQGARTTFYEESRGLVTAETNTNHVGMATGAFGDRSGNPGNSFAVFSESSKRNCDGDLATTSGADTASDSPTGTGSGGTGQATANEEIGREAEQVDGEEPACVLAEDFFAAAKRQAGSAITTAGIFGKPKLAAIFSGKKVDPKAFDADFLFTPCTPGDSEPPPYCRGTGRAPDGYAPTDDQVMTEVIRTVNEGVPADGQTKRPNLTFVNLPTVDSLAHGSGGPDLSTAYRAAVRLADQEIQDFVANQKRLGLWERTTMLLVSDHSLDTTRLGATLLAPILEADPSTRGRFLAVNNGSVDMIYLRDRTAPQAEQDQALADARRVLMTAEPPSNPIDEVLYRKPNGKDPGTEKTLDGAHPGWKIAGPRTGDLYVTANDGFAFDAAGVALTGNHGNPFTSDNFVAVVSGGPNVVQQQLGNFAGERFDDTLINVRQAQNVDVAPTVMALFGCAPPRNADPASRVLVEAFSALPPRSCAATPATPPSTSVITGDTRAEPPSPRAQACSITPGLRDVRARPLRGGRLAFSFSRTAAATGPVRVDVFQQSVGRRVTGNRRVARFVRSRSFTWSGRGPRVRDGVLFARLRVTVRGGRVSERRITLRRREGRFSVAAAFDRPPSCGLLTTFKLERPVFGGRSNRDLSVTFRLARRARVSVAVLRGTRVVRRFRASDRSAGLTHRLRLEAERLPRRGTYTIRIAITAGTERAAAKLTARRI